VRRRLRNALAVAVLGLSSASCAGQAESPPSATRTTAVPRLIPLSRDVPQAARAKLPVLARDSVERRARRMTVRVRNLSCEGVSSGSGFALAPDVLVTNRHVVAGADALEVSTWDGTSLRVAFAEVGVLGDLGVVLLEDRLPVVGEFGADPESGDVVTAVGYPLGGQLTLSEGIVADRTDGGDLGVPGTVVRITATVLPGNSGGPLLDERGEVVGIVYAIERATGFGLAIPAETLRRLARVGGFADVPPCGYR
jgi:S1-C subfamily serine protease